MTIFLLITILIVILVYQGKEKGFNLSFVAVCLDWSEKTIKSEGYTYNTRYKKVFITDNDPYLLVQFLEKCIAENASEVADEVMENIY